MIRILITMQEMGAHFIVFVVVVASDRYGFFQSDYFQLELKIAKQRMAGKLFFLL